MLIYFILFVSTFFSVYHLISSLEYKDKKVLYPVEQSGISVLVPCYNEALILKYTVEGLLNVDYDNLEVIFINDGSTDDTFQVLNDLLNLSELASTEYRATSDRVKEVYRSKKFPHMLVIDKYNSGKAGSLNVGISYAQKELIVTMDGDCVLEKNALKSMNEIFDDKDVIASGGVVHIMQLFKLNNMHTKIVLMQALDYIKGFYFYKASLAHNDALSIISGAFGVFRRSAIMEVGGFKTGLGEDIDITLRFQEYARKHHKKVVFNRNAICYTECPESVIELIQQRIRWQKGFIDAIINNSRFLLKNLFRSNVCFYIIIDALLSNSFATVVFFINIILLLTKLIYGHGIYSLTYYAITILFNIFCSFVAIQYAKKSIPQLNVKQLYYMIFYDMAVFQFLRIFFFLMGTITYYFDNKHWYKVNRTYNSYKI